MSRDCCRTSRVVQNEKRIKCFGVLYDIKFDFFLHANCYLLESFTRLCNPFKFFFFNLNRDQSKLCNKIHK